ncbi:histidinol-phosphate aminotransferase [Thermaurantimonas aggregans]|uniref:Histidinol-phosphate aminotransferase n=1 Tax=Thermaurantimonas aggregans TaxID=2173829 RepID=A0A401XJN5_9FLAO|nr:histidinol-phosphate transaminase [Thermaurantimonas aggregans]MCX8149263.1 histidinol-phosphate transaminase [Thermaurantimonas aggregans]GCD77245.1 histidinol-phosphate aminotransferase [Thermaurantimonas aggregans]
MTFDLDALLRPNIRQLKPYTSARDEFQGRARIYLDANENPFDDSPFHRYPDPHHTDLRQKISSLIDLPADHIFLGSGSDEAIDLLIRAFCTPGEHSILTCPPTYGMYEVQANIHDVGIQQVLLTPEFQLDEPAILQALRPFTRIIFLCSPNNPTGNLLSRTSIKRLLEAFHGIVVVDEAYVDFADQPGLTDLLTTQPNLVLLRTFSKAWGLAGLRVGMALANPSIINVLYRIKLPYNLSQAAQSYLYTALDSHKAINQRINLIRTERRRVAQQLSSLPNVLQVYPSDANFLLVRFIDPQSTYRHLLSNGIVVRDRSRQPLCEGCLRITIGTPAENDQLLQALAEI